MTLLEAVVIAAAGLAAGGINTIVGSGTLITFPTLLAFGVPPVTANVSNNIGLVPGSVAGAIGYRAELRGQGRRTLRLLSASLLGGVAGAVLLLVLPEGAFEAIVPLLILVGLLLVVFQPRLSAWVAARRVVDSSVTSQRDAPWMWPAVLLTGVYGGYFGAAQGVLLMGVLGIGLTQSLQHSNAVKNVLAASVNAVAGLIFVFVADVDWTVVALLAGGSVVGGVTGARVGRRLPPAALRGAIVIVGAVALTTFLVR